MCRQAHTWRWCGFFADLYRWFIIQRNQRTGLSGGPSNDAPGVRRSVLELLEARGAVMPTPPNRHDGPLETYFWTIFIAHCIKRFPIYRFVIRTLAAMNQTSSVRPSRKLDTTLNSPLDLRGAVKCRAWPSEVLIFSNYRSRWSIRCVYMTTLHLLVRLTYFILISIKIFFVRLIPWSRLVSHTLCIQ